MKNLNPSAYLCFGKVLALFALVLTASTSAIAGKQLYCKAATLHFERGGTDHPNLLQAPNIFIKPFGPFAGVYTDPNSDGAEGDAGLIFNQMGANCTDRKGNKFYSVFLGVGLSLKVSNDYFTISCPFISKKRLARQHKIGFGAVRLSAAGLVGGDATLAINHRLGVCVVAGLELGLGASATIGWFEIGEGDIEDAGYGSVLTGSAGWGH